ncbi:hypothetical protein KAU88_07540 [Candidatus Bathyarchaeota archaeon]|nr:hypothetical protein [Candidatus Bathyarchaeota archaeon]
MVLAKTERLGCKADVLNWESFTPNHLRSFFTKEWVRQRYLVQDDPNIPLLSKIMRHRDVVYTWIYLTKFVYIEDLRNEINRFQIPIEQAYKKVLNASQRAWIDRKQWIRRRIQASKGAQKL